MTRTRFPDDKFWLPAKTLEESLAERIIDRRWKAKPLPEILDDEKPWKVKDTGSSMQGSVTRKGAVHYTMNVPLQDEDCRDCGENHARHIRLHELAHVKWSNKEGPGHLADLHKVSSMPIMAAEDARIERCMLVEGVTRTGVLETGLCSEMVEPRHVKAYVDHLDGTSAYARQGRRWLLLMCIATANHAEGLGKLTPLLDDEEREFLNLCLSDIFDDPLDQDGIIKAAKRIDARFGWRNEDHEGPEIGYGRFHRDRSTWAPDKRPNEWGDMRIVDLTEHSPTRKVAYDKHRNCEEGTMVGDLQRWHVDGHVFRKPKVVRKVNPRAVLIDVSGSMRLGEADIEALIDQNKDSVVACYSGKALDGELRIVAKDGVVAVSASEHARYGTSNVIDGPALLWLAEQKGVRIWVSDGSVTGIGDMSADCLTAEAHDIVAQYRIVQVEDVRTAHTVKK